MSSIVISLQIGKQMGHFHQIPIGDETYLFFLAAVWKYHQRYRSPLLISDRNTRSVSRSKSHIAKIILEMHDEQPALLGFRLPPCMVVLGPATKIPGHFSQFTIPDEFWRLIQLPLSCRKMLVGVFHKSGPIPRFDLYTPAWLGFATND